MDELDIVFNNYVKEFKKLNTKDKRLEIVNTIKELIFVFEQLAIKDGIELKYLRSNEINDLNNDMISEGDFLEVLLVYIENAKNIIGEYLLNK